LSGELYRRDLALVLIRVAGRVGECSEFRSLCLVLDTMTAVKLLPPLYADRLELAADDIPQPGRVGGAQAYVRPRQPIARKQALQAPRQPLPRAALTIAIEQFFRSLAYGVGNGRSPRIEASHRQLPFGFVVVRPVTLCKSAPPGPI
jgi:hypothetical protein